jgi:hypothetical protein
VVTAATAIAAAVTEQPTDGIKVQTHDGIEIELR